MPAGGTHQAPKPMVPVNRPVGQNDVGMIAWVLTFRTPECPQGRKVQPAFRTLLCWNVWVHVKTCMLCMLWPLLTPDNLAARFSSAACAVMVLLSILPDVRAQEPLGACSGLLECNL